MLLHNPFFWISDLALVLIFISCTLLAYRFRHKSLLVMVPLWLLAISAISLLVHPILYGVYLTSPVCSLLILVTSLGLGSTGWYWSWLGKEPGSVQERLTSKKVFTWSAVFSGLLLSYVVWKLKQIGR